MGLLNLNDEQVDRMVRMVALLAASRVVSADRVPHTGNVIETAKRFEYYIKEGK